MSLALERLVYASTATGTTESLLNLASILSVSQRNNARDGLTGVLAAHNNRYIQVIEGPGQALDGLLPRLAQDPRHRDIVILGRTPIRERMFADWSMTSARFRPEMGPRLEALMAEASPSADRVVAVLKDGLDMA